jgi:hypothetical protein
MGQVVKTRRLPRLETFTEQIPFSQVDALDADLGLRVGGLG